MKNFFHHQKRKILSFSPSVPVVRRAEPSGRGGKLLGKVGAGIMCSPHAGTFARGNFVPDEGKGGGEFVREKACSKYFDGKPGASKQGAEFSIKFENVVPALEADQASVG